MANVCARLLPGRVQSTPSHQLHLVIVVVPVVGRPHVRRVLLCTCFVVRQWVDLLLCTCRQCRQCRQCTCRQAHLVGLLPGVQSPHISPQPPPISLHAACMAQSVGIRLHASARWSPPPRRQPPVHAVFSPRLQWQRPSAAASAAARAGQRGRTRPNPHEDLILARPLRRGGCWLGRLRRLPL